MRVTRPRNTESSIGADELCARYRAGEGLAALARAAGVSDQRVRAVLEANRVELRSPGWPKRRRGNDDFDEDSWLAMQW